MFDSEPDEVGAKLAKYLFTVICVLIGIKVFFAVAVRSEPGSIFNTYKLIPDRTLIGFFAAAAAALCYPVAGAVAVFLCARYRSWALQEDGVPWDYPLRYYLELYGHFYSSGASVYIRS